MSQFLASEVSFCSHCCFQGMSSTAETPPTSDPLGKACWRGDPNATTCRCQRFVNHLKPAASEEITKRGSKVEKRKRRQQVGEQNGGGVSGCELKI